MSAIAHDPLIAEAKERARRRRLALALVGLSAAGAVAATVGLWSSDSTRPVVAVAPICRSDQLHVALASGGPAAGTVFSRFLFKNTSDATCVISGWPTLRLVMRDGSRVTLAPRRDIASA